MLQIPPLISYLVTLASQTRAPLTSTSRPTPQSPTTIPKLRQLEFVWPTVGPNTRWPVPLWHRFHLSLKHQ